MPLAAYVVVPLQRTPWHVTTRRCYGSVTRYVCGSQTRHACMERDGTMATNGLRNERMQSINCWWRRLQCRFRIVSGDFVVACLCGVAASIFLCAACILRRGAASRHGVERHNTALLRNIGATIAWHSNAARTHATQRWRSMTCGTNECSYGAVGGGYENTASAS